VLSRPYAPPWKIAKISRKLQEVSSAQGIRPDQPPPRPVYYTRSGGLFEDTSHIPYIILQGGGLYLETQELTFEIADLFEDFAHNVIYQRQDSYIRDMTPISET
jgi:hypothetical protein